MRSIKNIVIHCTAGHGNLESIQRFWRDVRKWKSPGYHYFIDYDGTVTRLAPLHSVTNGVAGHNSNSIHIAYRGGVSKTNVNKAEDTRTQEQKEAIIKTIQEVLFHLKHTQSISNVAILGHRDFSPDKNGNGVIDSWERIKECPSFDAIPEYKHLIQ